MSQQEKLSLDFAPPNLGGKGFASRVPSSMLLARPLGGTSRFTGVPFIGYRPY
jgi:hypothetical protein